MSDDLKDNADGSCEPADNTKPSAYVWVYMLAKEVPDVMGQGMSLSSIVLGGEWVNGEYQLYPAFATEFDAELFKKEVGAMVYDVLALRVAIHPGEELENKGIGDEED